MEAKTATLAHKIATGKLDLIIAAKPFPLEGMKKRHLFSDYFYLATTANDDTCHHGVATPDDIDFARLRKKSIVSMIRCLHSEIRSISCVNSAQRAFQPCCSLSLMTLT